MKIKITENEIERFWKRVVKAGPDDCWLWNGKELPNCYGRFSLHGKTVKSSRFSFLLTHKKLTKGLFVCHKCGKKPCCNPAHLYEGTRLQNAKDALEHGHYCVGEENGQSVITKAIAEAIRNEYVPGKVNHRFLAKKYGITANAVKNIIVGNTWKCAGGKIIKAKQPGKEAAAHAVFTEEKALAIRVRCAAGETQASLAKEYGVVANSIFMIVTGKTWQFVGGPIKGVDYATKK